MRDLDKILLRRLLWLDQESARFQKTTAAYPKTFVASERSELIRCPVDRRPTQKLLESAFYRGIKGALRATVSREKSECKLANGDLHLPPLLPFGRKLLRLLVGQRFERSFRCDHVAKPTRRS